MTYYTIRHAYLDVVNSKENDRPYDFGEITKDKTGNIATNHVTDEYLLAACEDAWKSIPYEYRKGVYDHIVNDVKYMDLPYAHQNTYKRYTAQYVWFVAHGLGWV